MTSGLTSQADNPVLGPLEPASIALDVKALRARVQTFYSGLREAERDAFDASATRHILG